MSFVTASKRGSGYSVAMTALMELAHSLRPAPVADLPELRGNDGLTEPERAFYASRYRLNVACSPSDDERRDIHTWLLRKRGL